MVLGTLKYSQKKSNFASKPEKFGSRYDQIFEACRQSPIPEKDKLQYFRSMFNDDVRSYLTDEDRKEIYAKGIEKNRVDVAKVMLANGEKVSTISLYTGLSEEAVRALHFESECVTG